MFEIFLVMSSILYQRCQIGFSLSQFLSGLAFAEVSKKMILLSGP